MGLAGNERWDIRTEVDEGIMLSSGRPWRGIRVRYRKANTRGKFNSFLLSTDDETIPSFEMIEQAVGRHSTGRQ